MTLKFFAPDGDDREDITAEAISKLVLSGSQDYWETGSGDAAIRFTDDSADGEMILMVRDPHGVFVQFTEADTGTEWVLTNGDSEVETITIQQGGEPWELPRTFFVPREIAADAAREFAQSGKRPQAMRWTTF